MLRLDRIIADCGFYSRSEALGLIRLGRVVVDGRIVCSGAEKYDPDAVRILIDGQLLEYRKFLYLMLNKPQGYVSSTKDKCERTVMELLDSKYSKLGLFPVGRLDKDAEGLLLLTNDGEFAHSIISPIKKINKRYFVEIDHMITNEDIEKFAQGITLGDGTKCQPAILEPAPKGAYVTIHEGKYHQVKRMMAALGKPVTSLKRVAIGSLYLDEGLKSGQYREIYDEISLIYKDCASIDDLSVKKTQNKKIIYRK